jgi:ABC-2 type transport system permease protein
MAYVVTAIFLVLSGTFFSSYLAGTRYSDTSLRGFLSVAQYLILLFSAVLSMRLVAEERKLGTWELLLTVPVRDVEIIVGKFLGSLAVLAGMLALTLYYPVLLVVFGDPDIGPIFTSYVGLVLLGSASLAVGVFASSLTSNQLVSAVFAGGLLFALWFLGAVAGFAPGGLAELLSYLSLSAHFPDFIRGIIDTKALVYYVSVTSIFLFLAVRSTEADRWA